LECSAHCVKTNVDNKESYKKHLEGYNSLNLAKQQGLFCLHHRPDDLAYDVTYDLDYHLTNDIAYDLAH